MTPIVRVTVRATKNAITLKSNLFIRADLYPRFPVFSRIEDSKGSGVSSRIMTWPSLPLEEWKDTCATLHMWTQVVGKVRLAQTPLVNHWWNVPLYVSARGLTATAMPHGDAFFEMEFDFIDNKLVITSSDGRS